MHWGQQLLIALAHAIDATMTQTLFFCVSGRVGRIYFIHENFVSWCFLLPYS